MENRRRGGRAARTMAAMVFGTGVRPVNQPYLQGCGCLFLVFAVGGLVSLVYGLGSLALPALFGGESSGDAVASITSGIGGLLVGLVIIGWIRYHARRGGRGEGRGAR